MLPEHSQSLSEFTSFPANTFLFGVRKKYTHCIISWSPRTAFLKHFQSKCLDISVHIRQKIFVRKTKYDFIWWRGRLGKGWIISLRGSLFGPRRMFYNFPFKLKFFEIPLFSTILILPLILLKRWNFPNNLDFKGKIEAKFLIRSHFLSIWNNMTKK